MYCHGNIIHCNVVAAAHWATYPGPVFASWTEVKDFLLAVGDGDIRYVLCLATHDMLC